MANSGGVPGGTLFTPDPGGTDNVQQSHTSVSLDGIITETYNILNNEDTEMEVPMVIQNIKYKRTHPDNQNNGTTKQRMRADSYNTQKTYYPSSTQTTEADKNSTNTKYKSTHNNTPAPNSTHRVPPPNTTTTVDNQTPNPPTIDRQDNTSQIQVSPNMDRLNNTYSEKNTGPYIVHAESIDKNIGNLHPMALGKKIIMKYPGNKMDIINITKLNKTVIKIELKTGKLANDLVKINPFKEENTIMYIPTHRITRQGVIRNVDPNITENELMLDIDSDTEIVHVKRITRRSTDKTKYIPTYSVIIHFRTQFLPKYVYVNRTRCEVNPYVNKVTQCFSCLRFGHSVKNCKYPTRCNRCKGEHNSRECEDEGTPSCINCDGNHYATDNNKCPMYAEQKKIKEIMAESNISYFEARNTYKTKTYARVTASNNLPQTPIPEPTIEHHYNQRNHVHNNTPQSQSKPQSTENRAIYTPNTRTHSQNTNNTQEQIPRDILYNTTQYPAKPIGNNPYPPMHHHNLQYDLDKITKVIIKIIQIIFQNTNSSIPTIGNLEKLIKDMLSEGQNHQEAY